MTRGALQWPGLGVLLRVPVCEADGRLLPVLLRELVMLPVAAGDTVPLAVSEAVALRLVDPGGLAP